MGPLSQSIDRSIYRDPWAAILYRPSVQRFSTHSCLGVEVHVLAKPPNMVWGEACNVTDKSPIKPGARRVARRCYKRAEVSWVWPVLAILVKVSRVRYKAIWRFGAI